MRYDFIVETYTTERVKVLGVWSMFADQDLKVRPHTSDPRGRSVLEQMIHQCVSENFWFHNILGIDVKAPPLPPEETRMGFILRYRQDSANRLEVLKQAHEAWWEEIVQFFDVECSHAWIMMRGIAHTAHHRGQQTTLLRMLGHDLHSTYGPSADTGGLMQNQAPTIYAYSSTQELLDGELQGGQKRDLPGPGDLPPTERPDQI